MYEIGKVYIWQNLVGELSYLNGTETTVLGPLDYYPGTCGRILRGQVTDAPSLYRPDNRIIAEAGDLRPKNPPRGELSSGPSTVQTARVGAGVSGAFAPARIDELLDVAKRGRPDQFGRFVLGYTSAVTRSGMFREYVFRFHDGTHAVYFEDVIDGTVNSAYS